MRNLKRLLAMTLTMLMVVGCFAFTASAQSFDDVYDYADAIDVLSDLGVIWGYEDGSFGPDDAVLRWHMALWIAKMETGKVTTDDYLAVWRSEENYTNFKDVNVDQAIGAISYAFKQDVIIGTSATTFDPDKGITYQDALTMACRALGFSGAAMDKGYPWSYITKATSLGLEDGLSGIAYTDALTRAQTAQILYNALFAVGADGTTYAEAVFGLATVVITGTNNYKIIETESVIKTGFVSFNVLNADGTINDYVTYHLPATAFIAADANPDDYVGSSFKVTTKNNFKSLGLVIANESKTFTQAEIKGAGTATAPSANFTLDGVDYQAVTKYSLLYNAQGIKGNRNEILVYVDNETQASKTGYFKVDSSYNVLDDKGNIVAYYLPNVTGTYANPYAKKLSDGVYQPFADNAAVIAAGGVWYTGTVSEYRLTTNTYDLVKYNAYATAVAYDDNGDGIYDRLVYSYQEFGSLSYDANSNTYSTQTKAGIGVAKFFDADGKAIAAPTGSYIRYSYDPLSKYMTVYEVYKYATGLVTTIIGTGSITIGGTSYSISVPAFWGTEAQFTGVNNSLIGKQVNFILVDGKVVRVFDAANSATYIVFDNLTGLTTAGYATALVYAQSNKASIITIATIDGYSYQQYILNAKSGSLGNVTDGIASGTLFQGTKDALGFWHIKRIDEYSYLAYNGTIPNYESFNWSGVVFDSATPSIYFKNGIANTTDRFYYGTVKNYGTRKSFAQFATAQDTLYIVYNKSNDTFYTAVGIPVDNAKININGAMFTSFDPNASYIAKFVYVYDGSFSGAYLTNAWTAYQYDTVIYVPANASATKITNDLGTTGTLLGYTWQYGNVIDMVNGGFMTVQTSYNFMLDTQAFYTVSNGYVEEKIDFTAQGADIQEGLLSEAARFYSIISTNWLPDVEYSAYTIIYNLVGGNPVVNPADGALINQTVAAGTVYSYVPVYFYAGPIPAKRVILALDVATSTSEYGKSTAPYAPYTFNSTTNVFTALGAAERADANYFLVNEEVYLNMSSFNADSGLWWTENRNTYDTWMRLYTAAGVEVTNWEANFTALVDNVTIGSRIVRTPTYAIGIKRNMFDGLDQLPIGTYYLMWKYNNRIYKIWLTVQLTDVPTLLSGLNAAIYDVDMFARRNTPGQDGRMDTGRFLLDLGLTNKVSTGSSTLSGPFAAHYEDDFRATVFAIPYFPFHLDSAHNEWWNTSARFLVLEDDLDILTSRGWWSNSVNFRFDVNGEAVLDIDTLINSERDFECSSPFCTYETELDFEDDEYYYAILVESLETGERRFISMWDNWVDVNNKDNSVGRVRWAPSWDVDVRYDDNDDWATFTLGLDQQYDDDENMFANDNTFGTVLNRVKYNSWGRGVAYWLSTSGITAPSGMSILGTEVRADYRTTDITWYTETNAGTFNSEIIFNQDVDYEANPILDEAAFRRGERQKNFAFTWRGTEYQSFSGTYMYENFSVYYVLPFTPQQPT